VNVYDGYCKFSHHCLDFLETCFLDLTVINSTLMTAEEVYSHCMSLFNSNDDIRSDEEPNIYQH